MKELQNILENVALNGCKGKNRSKIINRRVIIQAQEAVLDWMEKKLRGRESK